MDSKNYWHIIAQFKKSVQLPHHNYPSHNLLSVDTLLQLSDGNTFPGSFPCYLPFEYEVKSNLVFFPGSAQRDDATDLVKKKLKWEKSLNNLGLDDLNRVISKVKSLRSKKPTKLSPKTKEYIEYFCSDPEPQFTGFYNWLYTGGSITSLEENGRYTLVCTDYSGKKPGFCLLTLTEDLNKVEYKSFYQLKTFSPILQLTCKTKSDKSLMICARQKNQLSLFRIESTATLTQPTKLLRKKTIDDKLITCSDISANCKLAAISDTNFDIHVFDVETRNKTYGFVGKVSVPVTIPDRWGQTTFGDFGLYVAFRDRLQILDLRVEDARPQLSFDPSTPTNDCEGISCMAISSNTDYLYLGTSHHLLQVDFRNGKAVQRWTHLMKNPPQFISTADVEEKELLVLQSWKVDEVVGVTNDRTTNECFLSKSLPCLLRSIKESLRLSRCHGVCLNPLLTKRMDFATTGINCLKNNKEVFMFAQNSGGDIFLTKIRKKTNGEISDFDEEETLESMKALESRLEKFETKANFDTVDMSHIIKKLELPKGKEKPPKKPEMYWVYHEMYAPESLAFCQDFLAQSLLKVWGYGPKESDHEDEIEKSHKKVLEWMDRI